MKESEFRYPGPKPYSKEMLVLMICDSIEAASRSLNEPNRENIKILIQNITKNQYEDGQYNQSDISFRELEKIQKNY